MSIKRFSELQKEFATLSRRKFLRKHITPFLMEAPGSQMGGFFTDLDFAFHEEFPDSHTDLSYPTLVDHEGEQGPRQFEDSQLDFEAENDESIEPMVIELKKSVKRHPERIYIGRSHDNDIQIYRGSISKRHCYFNLVDPQDGVSLVDTDSVNGTYLNDERLEPHTPAPVVPGDRISFAMAVEFIFLTPAQFFDLIAPEE